MHRDLLRITCVGDEKSCLELQNIVDNKSSDEEEMKEKESPHKVFLHM